MCAAVHARSNIYSVRLSEISCRHRRLLDREISIADGPRQGVCHVIAPGPPLRRRLMSSVWGWMPSLADFAESGPGFLRRASPHDHVPAKEAVSRDPDRKEVNDAD